jgi:hypothetical protein
VESSAMLGRMLKPWQGELCTPRGDALGGIPAG